MRPHASSPLEIQRHFSGEQDQNFQYKCHGCPSLRTRDNEDHSDNHIDYTYLCQQLSKKNSWCLVGIFLIFVLNIFKYWNTLLNPPLDSRGTFSGGSNHQPSEVTPMVALGWHWRTIGMADQNPAAHLDGSEYSSSANRRKRQPELRQVIRADNSCIHILEG